MHPVNSPKILSLRIVRREDMKRRENMKIHRKTPPLEDDTSNFPYYIIENILSRLPVESLLRFKTVCKSWNATISDLGFAKIHSNQLTISNSQHLYATDLSGDGTYKLIKFQGQELHVQSVVQFPSEEFNSAYFLCSCEGIILVKHYLQVTREKYVLWNPFTRNYSTFSCPYEHIIRSNCLVSYGLCFDKFEDDYKVIIVVTGVSKYLVYSIKNDRWTVRQSGFTGFVYFRGTYADGGVYWTMGVDGSCCNTIIYFDPKDNLIKKLHKPEDLKHANSLICLTNLNGNLCFYTRDQELMIETWLLKEYDGRKRWLKLVTTTNHESWAPRKGDPFFCVPRPIYLTSDNEVVFKDLHSMSYAVYCPKKQKFGEAKKFPACSEMIEFTCSESLNFPATPRE